MISLPFNLNKWNISVIWFRSNNRSVFLTQKYLDGRLADAILFLHNIYGYQSDNKTIDVSLSRKEIANLSNMNTSNAIRTLSTFASDNIISLKGRKIQILDLKKLENISEISTKWLSEVFWFVDLIISWFKEWIVTVSFQMTP